MNAPSLTSQVRRPLPLLLATLVVALAAGFGQSALAQPYGGMPGMGPMGGPGGPGGPGMHGMYGGGPGMGPMRGGMGGMGGMGMPMMQNLPRMLDLVNATPEQRTQIGQIARSAATDLRALHEGARPLHDQMRAAFSAPTVDANAVEGLRQKMQAVHDQASKRQMQAMIDVSRVLSADQRKLLADRMAQRQEMAKRHRAEREALEQPRR